MNFIKSLHLLCFICLIILISCSKPHQEFADNVELIKMCKADEEMRMSDSDDPYEPSDKARRTRILELLAENKIRTNNDKMNAALILDHTGLILCNENIKSVSPENYLLAHFLAKSSFENGNEDAAYFTAVTYDRYLLYTEGFQRFGTQRIYEGNKLIWAPIDPSTTDEERSKFKVPSLKELLEQHEIAE